MLYADYNGSAPISSCVKELLEEILKQAEYANPNAAHKIGQNLYMEQENARSLCAKILGAKSSQLIFNSGSTESISHIFNSMALKAKETDKKSIIISSIEHPAVCKNAEYYCDLFGFQLHYIDTKNNGTIDLEDLKTKLNSEVALVAIMAANNETGVIQPYKEIASLCGEHEVPYLCDTTQLIGKAPFNFQESGIDFACTSSHKVGGLIGSGVLLAKDPKSLKPFIIGGNQESGHRGGTQNYIGVSSFACALKSCAQKLENLDDITSKRNEFEKKLKEKFPQIVIFGEDAPRVATTSFVSLPGTKGQQIQTKLEKEKILVTTSSACCDSSSGISRILQAMKVSENDGAGAIRISIGQENPDREYEVILNSLEKIYSSLN